MASEMSRDIKTKSKVTILRQIIDLNPNMIFAKDRNGRFLLVNRAVADSLGMTVEELTGRLHAEVHPDPEEVEQMLAADRKVIDSGEPVIIPEESYLDNNGNRRWLHTIKVPFIAADTNEPAVLGVAVDITDAKDTENALRESEQRYKLLFENARCPITVFDREGTVLMINSISAMMYGMPADRIIGMSIQDILPGQAGMILERNRKVLETGRGMEYEDELEFPTGTRWLWSNLQPSRNVDGDIVGVQVIAHDITEHKFTEEKLRSIHKRLEATLNALPDLLFETDRHGHILDFRAPHPELLYRSPGEFLHKAVAEVLPEEAAETIMSAIDQAVELGKSGGHTYALEIGEETLWFEISVVPNGDPKSPDARFIGLARDITERKRNEDALTEKNIALRHILEHIENDKQEHQLQTLRQLEGAILPLLAELRKKVGPNLSSEVRDIENTFNMVLGKDLNEFKRRYARLTSRESEVCDMIRAGMASKEISNELHLSLYTVLKHREQIRKKLGITNKNVSLVTYLRLHSAQKNT